MDVQYIYGDLEFEVKVSAISLNFDTMNLKMIVVPGVFAAPTVRTTYAAT